MVVVAGRTGRIWLRKRQASPPAATACWTRETTTAIAAAAAAGGSTPVPALRSLEKPEATLAAPERLHTARVTSKSALVIRDDGDGGGGCCSGGG